MQQQNKVYPDPAYPQAPPQGVGVGYGGQSSYGQLAPNRVIVQAAPPRPFAYLAFSIITLIFVNFLFGLISTILSVQSSRAADNGDILGAWRKGRAALGLNIAALFISAITIGVVIRILF